MKERTYSAMAITGLIMTHYFAFFYNQPWMGSQELMLSHAKASLGPALTAALITMIMQRIAAGYLCAMPVVSRADIGFYSFVYSVAASLPALALLEHVCRTGKVIHPLAIDKTCRPDLFLVFLMVFSGSCFCFNLIAGMERRQAAAKDRDSGLEGSLA